MHPLHRKLWRDAWHYRGQLAAIGAVAAAGIALFVTLRSMHDHLRTSRDQYYATASFADVFANVRRAPGATVRTIADLSGVRRAEGRIVSEIIVDVPGVQEGAIGRVISIPVPRAPMLNDLSLTRGRWPDATRANETLVSSAFAEANGLAPGDSLSALINGRRRWLHIAGVAISPEFVYAIGGASLFPDNRRFGALWMAHGTLAAALDMQGAVNDLLVSVASGRDTTSVVRSIDATLARYGGRGAYLRSEQVSDQFLSGEIEETQVTSILLPGVFLAVTAFLLHVVLSRLIGVQREEIATLRAFGYTRQKVSVHLLMFALLPVLVSLLAGAAAGLWGAHAMAGVYARFFQFPSAAFVADWSVIGQGALVALAAGLVGAGGAAWHSATLAPAEAMRPIAPPRYRRGLLEYLRARPRPQIAIIVRSLERRPWRALLSIFALALAGGLVVTSMGTFDTIEYMKELQFHRAWRADATVTFAQSTPANGTSGIRRLDGVHLIEGFRAIPVRLSRHDRTYRTTIMALPRSSQLRSVVDLTGRAHAMPPTGLLLSTFLAETLRVSPGQMLHVEVLEGDRRASRQVVAGTVDDPMGMIAYMSDDAVTTVAGGGLEYSGALLKVDPAHADALYIALKALPGVAGVAARDAALQSFEATIEESFRISLVITLGFACIIAFGVVYNSVRVTLSERGRELASLRILGFTRREVSTMLLGEHALLALASIPLAMLVADFLMWLIAERFASTLFRLPVAISWQSRIVGIVVIGIAVLVSAWSIVRRIARLDLIEVLKTRE